MSHPNPKAEYGENEHKHEAKGSMGKALNKKSKAVEVPGSYFGKDYNAKKLRNDRKRSMSERLKRF